jgi:DNA polymerase V
MMQSLNSGKTTGFASPAQGYEEAGIDLNKLIIANAPATFFFRQDSSEMADLGLKKGALLAVDRSRNPKTGQFAVIKHEGFFLCRLMLNSGGKTVFTNGTTDIVPIIDETEVVGAVTASIQIYAHDFSY